MCFGLIVVVGKDSSVDISHHYGLERFREFGAVIAQTALGKFEFQSIVEGSENSVSVYTGALAVGVKAVGEFHTHPWKYPQLKNIAFSPRDIVNTYQARESIPFHQTQYQERIKVEWSEAGAEYDRPDHPRRKGY